MEKNKGGWEKNSSEGIQSQGWATRFFTMTSLSLVATGVMMFSEFL
jgi:hypothetical protein